MNREKLIPNVLFSLIFQCLQIVSICCLYNWCEFSNYVQLLLVLYIFCSSKLLQCFKLCSSIVDWNIYMQLLFSRRFKLHSGNCKRFTFLPHINKEMSVFCKEKEKEGKLSMAVYMFFMSCSIIFLLFELFS